MKNNLKGRDLLFPYMAKNQNQKIYKFHRFLKEKKHFWEEGTKSESNWPCHHLMQPFLNVTTMIA